MRIFRFVFIYGMWGMEKLIRIGIKWKGMEWSGEEEEEEGWRLEVGELDGEDFW